MNPTHTAHQLPSRAAVVGAGAWGTTFASLLAEAGAPTTVWARRQEVAAEINSGTNSRYAPSLSLPPEVRATTDMRAAVAGAGIVVVALPSQLARGAIEPLAGAVEPGALVVSLM